MCASSCLSPSLGNCLLYFLRLGKSPVTCPDSQTLLLLLLSDRCAAPRAPCTHSCSGPSSARALRAAHSVLRAHGAKQILHLHLECGKGAGGEFPQQSCFVGQNPVLQETGKFPISTRPFLGKVSTHHIAAVPSRSPSACAHQQLPSKWASPPLSAFWWFAVPSAEARTPPSSERFCTSAVLCLPQHHAAAEV